MINGVAREGGLGQELNIVDEDDNIIGVEDRDVIHEKGLLHREVHVYFVTPERQIIFQHRAKDKDTFPDLLDATVGGHVEIGDSYEKTAVKEAFEETGISIDASELILVDKVHKLFGDNVTGKVNYAFQQEYIYIYDGKVEDLKMELGKSLGFEAWEIEDLTNISDVEKQKFISYLYDFMESTLIDFINNKLKT